MGTVITFSVWFRVTSLVLVLVNFCRGNRYTTWNPADLLLNSFHKDDCPISNVLDVAPFHSRNVLEEGSDTCIMECIGCCTVSFMECFVDSKFQETKPCHPSSSNTHIWMFSFYFLGTCSSEILWKKIRYMHHGMYWMLHSFFHGMSINTVT